MSLNITVIIAYIVGIILLFIVGRLLLVPMKIVIKLLYNAVIGGIVLLIINFLGGMFGYHIALNVLTALIVGTLGIPGIILLVILKMMYVI